MPLDQPCPPKLFRVEVLFVEPRLEPEAQLARPCLVRVRAHHPAIGIEGDPVPAGRVDVVVHVQLKEGPGLPFRLTALRGDHEAARYVVLVVAVVPPPVPETLVCAYAAMG